MMCLLKSMMNVFPDYVQRKVESWGWYFYLIVDWLHPLWVSKVKPNLICNVKFSFKNYLET